MSEISSEAVRRYLLGAATEQEAEAIEIEYIRREPALDRVAAIEEELIEDFLAGDLAPSDRDRFERVYLASPVHRQRVDTIRRLNATSAGARVAPMLRLRSNTVWRSALAVAATVLLAVGGMWWMRTALDRRGTTEPAPRPESSTARREPERPAARPQTRVVAVTLSPLATRSAGDASRIVIPSGTDVVAVDLESDGTNRSPASRAVLRTASGDEVWQGTAAAPPGGAGPGVAARIEVPAVLLRPDDYVIALFSTGPNGSRESARYVLHVRDR